MKSAVVVGAQGVIGRYIVEKLASLPDWQVTGLSRRRGEDGPRQRHVSVDLLNAQDAKAKLQGLTHATHVFYAAFQAGSGPAADYAKNIAANRDMLVNSVSAIASAAPATSIGVIGRWKKTTSHKYVSAGCSMRINATREASTTCMVREMTIQPSA